MNDTSDMREIIISEVQTRPSLWDDTHPQYKNIERNKKLWEEIGKLINLTGNETKLKWKNIKDKFRKELQKQPTCRSGDGGSLYKSKWPFFNQLLFIKDSLMPSCMSGNLNIAEDQNTQSPSFDENNDIYDESDVDVMGTSSITDVLSPSAESTALSHSTLKSKRKKCSNEDDINTFLELEKQKIAILKKAQERETKTNEDPDAQFLLSFLPYLKEFDPLEKLEVRSQMQNVVLNAYRRKKYSLQANYQPCQFSLSVAQPQSSQYVLPNNTTTSTNTPPHLESFQLFDQNEPTTSRLISNQATDFLVKGNNNQDYCNFNQ